MKLSQYYKEKIVPMLMDELTIQNPMSVPRVKKIVVNIGLKEAASDKVLLEKSTEQLAVITGQRPKVTRAKKSIANFKLREGDKIGLMVTLRGKRMYDFMTRLFKVVLPRVRDFQGVSNKAFDESGNYSLGLAEQIVFPEIEYAKVDKIRGLQITFVIVSADLKSNKRLLELLGMPFKKEGV